MQPHHEQENPIVEEYLKSIDARLKALSSSRREDEVREIRQHLNALVAGHQARGLGDKEAAEAAVRQFGHAERVGGDLQKAWDKREHKLPLWYLGVLFLSMFVLIFGFFTSVTAPGDFPYALAPRIGMSMAMACASISITYFAHKYRMTH